jgi:peptide/nickel transport system substrate-binding protein
MACALVALASCTDSTRLTGGGGGTLVIAVTGEADNLFPPLVQTTIGRQVTEQIYDGLADVGLGLNTIGDSGFEPRLAQSWSWAADSLSIAFHLNPRARWHDGNAVTSNDVRFTFSIYTDSLIGASSREQLADIDSVTAPDSLTSIFWFRKRSPRQFFDATNQMLILPKHVFDTIARRSLVEKGSEITPVGSGRYRFANWKHGASLELTSDSANYRDAGRIRRLIWTKVPSASTAAKQLFAGEADLYDTMRPENVTEAASLPTIKVISSLGTDYVFMRFNLRDPAKQSAPHPLFTSRDLRRALTMAVDRKAMVRNVFDSLAAPGIGPTIRPYPTTDTSAIEQIPYDPAAAARLLDSLGWRPSSKDGTRERNGKKLHFRILVPSSSTNRQRMGTLLQEQFRKIGAAVDLDEVDYGTFTSREAARDFDTELGNFHLGPSDAIIREAWTTSAARSKAGNNSGWYSNPIFDAYVDSATSTMDSAASRRYYTRAYSIANSDAPAIWLYEPRLVVGVHRRVRTGSIRPDAWWSNLADWDIPE